MHFVPQAQRISAGEDKCIFFTPHPAVVQRCCVILPIDRGSIPLKMETSESGPTPAENNEMTGELHRRRVLNFLDILYSGDVEGALARCTADIEFIANAPVDLLPHMGPRRGTEAMRAMWTTIHTRYSEMRCEVPIIIAEGDKVAASIRVFFRKRGNARMVQFDIAAFYTFREGLIAGIREIIDTFDLVEQVLERDVSALLKDEPRH
jgi:ketosteroid isomerase-like protein